MPQNKQTSAKKKRRSGEESGLFSTLCKNAALGTAISLLCAFSLSLVATLLCLRSGDPLKMILPFGLASLYLSALLGGIITVRRHGESSLLCGALCGLFLLVFFWIVSLLFKGENSFSLLLTFLLRLLTPLFSILGALLGQKRTTRRPHRKR